ncbi:YciI family protein [Methylocystis echinoides]|uniref:YciI family protein n=1 Tax=Methylocystis echinoides TaxID=29468 RepID=UPI003440CE70
MLFVALCQDKPGHVDLRLSTRAAHLAFLETHAAQVKLGGPFLDGETPVGSMLILDCPDEAAARALLAEDPYAQAGLFERVELRAWKRVVGAAL